MKKRMKKVATLCLAGVTAMSTVGVTGSAVFAKGDTNYDVDNMDFENVELRVAFRFNNGSDTDGQAKWYYKALDEFNKENEGKIHVTDAAFIWSRNAGNCKNQGNRILQNLLLPSEYVRNNSSSPDVDIYVKSELWYL